MRGGYSLAVGLGAVDGRLAGSSRALCVSGLLGDDGDASLVSLSGRDANSLDCASVYEPLYIPLVDRLRSYRSVCARIPWC